MEEDQLDKPSKKADLLYFKGGVEDVEWKDAGTAHKYLKHYFKSYYVQ